MDEKVNAMAKALSPAYLRIGGTTADMLYFIGDGTGRKPIRKAGHVEYTSQQYDEFQEFAQRNDLSILFDFNYQQRLPDGSWDSTNTQKLLDYSHSKGYGNMAFELGNEVDH